MAKPEGKGSEATAMTGTAIEGRPACVVVTRRGDRAHAAGFAVGRLNP